MNYTSMDLDELLKLVDSIFGIKDNRGSSLAVIEYSLNRFPYGWRFEVVNSWQNWMKNKYAFEFGASSPEYAVIFFLDYITVNDIDVPSLRGGSSG